MKKNEKYRKCPKCKGMKSIYAMINAKEALIPCNLCSGEGQIMVKDEKPQITQVSNAQKDNNTSFMLLLYAIWLFALVFVVAIHAMRQNMDAILKLF